MRYGKFFANLLFWRCVDWNVPLNCTHHWFRSAILRLSRKYSSPAEQRWSEELPIYLSLMFEPTCFPSIGAWTSHSTCSFVNRRNFHSTPLIKFILECKIHGENAASSTSGSIHDTTKWHFTASPMCSVEMVSDTNSDLWFCWCFGNSLGRSAHKHLNFDNIPWITFAECVLKWNDTEKITKNTWREFLFD